MDYVECLNNDFDGTLNSQNQPLQEPYIEFPSSEANSVNSNYSQHSEPVVKKLSPRSILALDDADYELEKAKMKNSVKNGTVTESNGHSPTSGINQTNDLTSESHIMLNPSYKDTNHEAMPDEWEETEDRSYF